MKKLTANWGLKLISLLFAMIVWFLVTNINDPITPVRFSNIQVMIKNDDLITGRGQVYSVLDGSNVINSVTVYAPRSVIDSLSQNNIVATADVQNLSSLNTISIDITTNKYSDKIDRIVPSADLVKLDIEKKKSKQLQLEAKTIGEPKEGFIVGEINTDENLIKISGAESIVDRVSKAEVDLDVTGLQTDIGSNEDIVLYDKDGEVVDSTNLEMKTRSVKVNVPILQTKKVPVRYRISGKTADGYAQTGDIDSNPGEVLIAGKKSVLSTVDAIIVEGEDLDVTGLKDNFTYTADLKQFLPAGVVFADDKFDGKATVVVYIGSVSESTVDVSTKNIAVEGVPEGFEVTIDSNGEDDKVSLTLAGLDSRINTLNNSALRGTINIEQVMKENNLTELAEGSYRADVEWNLPKGVEVKNTVSVHISVKKAD